MEETLQTKLNGMKDIIKEREEKHKKKAEELSKNLKVRLIVLLTYNCHQRSLR